MRSLIMAASLLAAASAAAAQSSAAPHAAVFTPGAFAWQPAPAILPPGAQLAVVEGDPSQPGAFTMRLRMPDGYRIPPHYHPAEERVTVIQGTFRVGMGERSGADMTALPAGSYAQLTPLTRHFARAEGETIIQLHGTGPWSLVYVNPSDDPRNAARP